MSKYVATVRWERGEQLFSDNRYSRGHTWNFDGGQSVAASSSPHVVPLPYSVEANVDPEEAFIAALSSCHMLFFLSIAAKQGFIVDQYIDQASGILEMNTEGQLAMTRVTLAPRVSFCGERRPSLDQLQELHHSAHAQCYIANSVKTELVLEIPA
jgi:organic hydroperoxide reductase OsmC/OhrA